MGEANVQRVKNRHLQGIKKRDCWGKSNLFSLEANAFASSGSYFHKLEPDISITMKNT